MSIVSRFLQRHDDPAVAPLGFAPMQRRHLRQVLAIEKQVYPRPWTPGVFTGEIDQVRSGQRYYAVALRRGEVLGYGGLILLPDEAHVTNIAVDPAHHRTGIGRRLLVHLVRRAIAAGASSLSLEVRVSNQPAQAMYQSFGFVPAGVRQRYYENTEDAIVMWVSDIDAPDYAAMLDRMEAST